MKTDIWFCTPKRNNIPKNNKHKIIGNTRCTRLVMFSLSKKPHHKRALNATIGNTIEDALMNSKVQELKYKIGIIAKNVEMDGLGILKTNSIPHLSKSFILCFLKAP
ncbi:MAG: hypothetical protein IKT35_00015 [Clostridia bacterium]|nr:hypothetical protein [Clostridia bacterium]